jgi:hypothetical protein
MLKIFLEHLIVLSGEGFNCDGNLFPEVIIAVFAIGPDNQLFERQDV